MAAKGGRGGRRQRRFVKQEQFGPIDRKAISDLLTMLAPDVADDRREMALEIVVKGIELVREHAPTELRLPPGNAQKNRRALEKLKKGKAEIDLTFNSFAIFGGKLYGVGSTGLCRFEDEPVERIEVTGLDPAILSPMRAMSMLQQRLTGFKNFNPNVLYNPVVPCDPFDEFWAVYPKKAKRGMKRKSVEAEWKAKELDARAGQIIADVKNRIANDGRWRKSFIPDPLIYITQERWDDELQPRKPGGDAGVVEVSTLGDALVDEAIKPDEWDVELAGYVYFAITRGLGVEASPWWYEVEPAQMRNGWNFGRLFALSAKQAGMPLPSSRSGMEELLKRGKDTALEIAISYSDKRKFTALEIEFPKV